MLRNSVFAVRRMIDRLRQQYSLGQKAIAAEARRVSMVRFAAKHGYSEHAMRKIKAFARELSAQDV